MKKIIIKTLIIILSSSVLFAQDNSDSGTEHNYLAALGAGPVLYFGDHGTSVGYDIEAMFNFVQIPNFFLTSAIQHTRPWTKNSPVNDRIDYRIGFYIEIYRPDTSWYWKLVPYLGTGYIYRYVDYSDRKNQHGHGLYMESRWIPVEKDQFMFSLSFRVTAPGENIDAEICPVASFVYKF